MRRDEENPMRASRLTMMFLSCLLMTYASSEMLPGIHAETAAAALMTGAVLGLAYIVLRPVLRLLALPVGCLTLGLSGFVIDTVLLMICAQLIEGFSVEGLIWAAAAAIMIDIVAVIAGGR